MSLDVVSVELFLWIIWSACNKTTLYTLQTAEIPTFLTTEICKENAENPNVQNNRNNVNYLNVQYLQYSKIKLSGLHKKTWWKHADYFNGLNMNCIDLKLIQLKLLRHNYNWRKKWTKYYFFMIFSAVKFEVFDGDVTAIAWYVSAVLFTLLLVTYQCDSVWLHIRCALVQ